MIIIYIYICSIYICFYLDKIIYFFEIHLLIHKNIYYYYNIYIYVEFKFDFKSIFLLLINIIKYFFLLIKYFNLIFEYLCKLATIYTQFISFLCYNFFIYYIYNYIYPIL